MGHVLEICIGKLQTLDSSEKILFVCLFSRRCAAGPAATTGELTADVYRPCWSWAHGVRRLARELQRGGRVALLMRLPSPCHTPKTSHPTSHPTFLSPGSSISFGRQARQCAVLISRPVPLKKISSRTRERDFARKGIVLIGLSRPVLDHPAQAFRVVDR